MPHVQKCRITGIELPPQPPRRGRPQEYLNADARKLAARMKEVEKLAERLSETVGFTKVAEAKFRGWGFSVGNALNRNVLKIKRRNPNEYMHRLATTGPSGERYPVCGLDQHFTYVPTPGGRIAAGELAVTEHAELVDCPDCLAAEV